MVVAVEDRLLAPGNIRQVRFDLTSRCNLRCVYCAVSHPEYQGVDMSDAIAREVIRLIVRLAEYNSLEPIDLNGHGETTYRQGWPEICFALTERGIPVRLTSNFAKSFTDRELDALACMDSIAISMDTSDRVLLRALRRRVDLGAIVTNIVLVKAAALKLHRAPPRFGILCGLYDKNTLEWDIFARFIVALGVARVSLWSLTEHAGLNVPEEARVRPPDDLDDVELRPRVLSVMRGLEFLQQHDICHCTGRFR
jgi:MoaA/NifB/PqqE/SkfB family radical SAM enzyme